MAGQMIYNMEAVNLICGDVGNENQPGASTHLTLRELKLPGLEENYVDHIAGGAHVGIEVFTHINRLESTFNLAGWQPSVQAQFGRSRRSVQRYTAHGVIREQRTGRPLKTLARIWGRMGRMNPTNFSRGSMQEHEFAIRSITHYELYMQQYTGAEAGASSNLAPLIYWDFFESRFEIGGIDILQEERFLLAIPTGSPGLQGDIAGQDTIA